ncbi:MAG: peptidoglycan-N-acetylglucosamine deacetylase [Thermoleophilaceae bacterium]|nr:peptidoglycan-N-acetylglucosamine deacetylase [Thermoleophilaceae bacterium]
MALLGTPSAAGRGPEPRRPRELHAVRSIADRDDVRGPLDIASTGAGQQGREFVWHVRTRGAWGARDIAEVPGRHLCLLLRHGRTPGAPDALLCVAARRHGRPLALEYATLGAHTHRYAVRARIHRRDRHSFSARFSPAAIGLRAGRIFRWQVQSAWSEYGVCNGPAACTDDAPDSHSIQRRLLAVHPVTCPPAGAHFRTNGSRSHRELALTFDDGPSTYTPDVLRVLERKHVPATFFLIGRQVAGRERYVRRALADGDVIGDHTWDHANVTGGGSSAHREIVSTRDAIRRAGFDPCLFRAPGGGTSGSLISEAWHLRMNTIQWDVDPRDWSDPGSDAIYRRVTEAVRPGSIVVMHDGGGPRGQTVGALGRIIDTLRRRGYRFKTVPGLLGLRVAYGRG